MDIITKTTNILQKHIYMTLFHLIQYVAFCIRSLSSVWYNSSKDVSAQTHQNVRKQQIWVILFNHYTFAGGKYLLQVWNKLTL